MRAILQRIRAHCDRCLKFYLYLGVAFVVLGILLRVTFWGMYTTEAGDIAFDSEDHVYPGIDPGENIRIHGSIEEIWYFGAVETDLPDGDEYRSHVPDFGPYPILDGRRFIDNKSGEELRYENTIFGDLYFYNTDFTRVDFVNVTFENVIFIDTVFSMVRFTDTRFENVSFVDTTFQRTELTDVRFSDGFGRDLLFERCVMTRVDLVRMEISRGDLLRVEWTGGHLSDSVFNEVNITGMRYHDHLWEGCTFRNTIFDVVIFGDLVLRDNVFPDTVFLNIFIDHDGTMEHFDHTYILSGNVYIRTQRDLRRAFTRNTSFYGRYRIVHEAGNITGESGEGITYAYEMFEDLDTHRSLRIEGIFYFIIMCGLTSVTYSFGGKAILMALVKFFLPFVFSSIGILVLYFALTWETFEKVGKWMILYFFPPLGKESVIPLAIAEGVNPLLIASAIAFIDIMVGLFLVWNFDLARKIPLIGKFICRIESRGNEILTKKPWVERLAFTGIVLFVMFPFQGSGAVGATIVGRMLGMDPKKLWYAVIIGAIAGCLIIAYTSAFAITFLLGIGLAWAILLVTLVVIFIILFYNYEKWGDWFREVRSHFDQDGEE